jgi:DNA mismatch repair protein MutL
MRRIHILPDTLANQIAAGEVVERPASVVKELIENALDAAATRVEVAIRHGGRAEIRVADDGCGMGRDDALLALDRHATSKIATPDDLRAVRTFGFRGEALPSIASVARLVLETAEGGGVGTRVRVAGGRVEAVEDIARQPGTTVVVRNLFFNVPARAKFLRSAPVESRQVAEVVTVLALANLSSGFRLTSNDRQLLDVPPTGSLVDRVAALWGDEAAARLVAVAHETRGIRVAGLIERPDRAGTGARRVHLFVGGRPFRDRGLALAAERGFATTIPVGVRPSLLLYLELPAGDVDVNVHPSKAEVRFRERHAVEAAVEAAVRAALGELESAATLDGRPAPPQLHGAWLRQTPRPEGALPENQLAFFVAARAPGQPAQADAVQGGEEPEVGGRRPRLWQVHDSYIIAETRGGVLIIDQHSAHERVLFEELMAAFRDGGAPSQRLLFPLTLRLSPAEYQVAEQSLGLFSQAGFEVEPFGGRSIIVHAAPHPHPRFQPERCLREMLTELAEGSELTRAATSQQERIAMTFACKAAVKAGQPLAPSELERLFDRLFETELPSHDVHGRPTIVRLSLEELERRFGRHG